MYCHIVSRSTLELQRLLHYATLRNSIKPSFPFFLFPLHLSSPFSNHPFPFPSFFPSFSFSLSSETSFSYLLPQVSSLRLLWTIRPCLLPPVNFCVECWRLDFVYTGDQYQLYGVKLHPYNYVIVIVIYSGITVLHNLVNVVLQVRNNIYSKYCFAKFRTF